jgi:hypothetical protein
MHIACKNTFMENDGEFGKSVPGNGIMAQKASLPFGGK